MEDTREMSTPDLGTGIQFPFEISNGLKTTSDMQHLAVSIMQRLLTRKGERVIRPWFGCNLQDYQDWPINDQTLAYMRYEIYEALKDEDRIEIKAIVITQETRATLNILIECIVSKDIETAFVLSYDREIARWEGQWL